MPTSLPSNVSYGQVIGRFLYAEGLNDGDAPPDGTAAVGTVTFAPSVSRVADTSATPPVNIFPKPVVCTIDASGYLTDPNGFTGAYLVATDDPDLNPHDWTYKVTIALAGIKTPTTFDIAVPKDAVTDLAVVAPVVASNGITYVVGPAGPAGADGTAGSVLSVAGRSGAVVLTLADSADTASFVRMVPAERTKLTGIATAATANSADATLLARANHTGTQSADTLTDGTAFKAMTAAERTKLAGITAGATVNSADATLLARANHTGTQTSSTVSDFTEAVEDAVAALFGRSTMTGITWTYNDASATLSATVSGGGGIDAETARDTIGSALVGAGVITVTVNDVADTITISTTATANDTDANLKARANHTGTQAVSTITGLTNLTTTASSATPTPTGDSLRNRFTVTALAAAAAFAAPSGTAAEPNMLVIRIKDNGTARALSWNAIYRAIGVTLPTTTVVGKTLYIGCVYNAADSKWDVIAVSQEA